MIVNTLSGCRFEDLYAAISDPVMDTMNFLNEVTARYPDAISFAPGRPFDGFFGVEHIFGHLRRYVDHLAGQGAASERIRDALFQRTWPAHSTIDRVSPSVYSQPIS